MSPPPLFLVMEKLQCNKAMKADSVMCVYGSGGVNTFMPRGTESKADRQMGGGEGGRKGSSH